MRIRVLGVDPGINGACAILEGDGARREVIDAIDIPTTGDDRTAARRVNARAIFDWIGQQKYAVAYAFIENVGSFPDQGIASAFRFGRAAGAIEAAVACSGTPLVLVAPVVWKKMFALKGRDKEASRQMALRRHPSAGRFLARKADHQRAEAILIAEFGLVTELGRRNVA